MKRFLSIDKIQVFISSIALLILWQVIALKIDNPIYLPKIQVVLQNISIIITDEYFMHNIVSSIYRTGISFSVALALSLLLGILSSFSRLINNILKPINAISISIPTMILVVLALIWFDKDKAPYIVGIFIVFPILYEGVMSSIFEIDKNIIEMSDVYKVSNFDKLHYIYIPSIKFKIVSLLISTISLAFKVVIAGEIHGQPKYGIGTVIQYEKMNFNTEAIFGWIVIIAFISFLLDILQKKLQTRVFRWKI